MKIKNWKKKRKPSRGIGSCTLFKKQTSQIHPCWKNCTKYMEQLSRNLEGNYIRQMEGKDQHRKHHGPDGEILLLSSSVSGQCRCGCGVAYREGVGISPQREGALITLRESEESPLLFPLLSLHCLVPQAAPGLHWQPQQEPGGAEIRVSSPIAGSVFWGWWDQPPLLLFVFLSLFSTCLTCIFILVTIPFIIIVGSDFFSFLLVKENIKICAIYLMILFLQSLKEASV